MANPTVEAGVKLPVRSIMDAGKGAHLWEGEFRWRLYDGEEIKVGFRAERAGETVSVMLAHRGRRMTRDGGGIQGYPVEVASIPMRFGGVRWYWRCPRSGRRAPHLFLARSAACGSLPARHTDCLTPLNA